MHHSYTVMLDRPDGKTVAGGALYWVAYTVVLPFLLVILASSDALLPSVSQNSQLVIVFYLINFVAVAAMFRQYLQESFFNVRCYPRRFFSAVTIAGSIAFAVQALLTVVSFATFPSDIFWASSNLLPIAELPLTLSVSSAIAELPVLGTLCVTVFVPVVMCCLYYGVAFAPIAVDHPRLAYIAIAILSAIPRLTALGNTGYPVYQLAIYVMQLPWHLCACWAYRKADTIWAPITMYAAVNLLSELIWLALLFFL